MSEFDLSSLEWTLRGWRPFAWKLAESMETGEGLCSDVGPFVARVPSSVQQTLLDAGVIEDWHLGVNSRACEWVEHRHWGFSAVLPEVATVAEQCVVLDARGLDYSGWLLVDGKEVGQFVGALVPHRFDLTAAMSDGKEHRLTIVFDEPPREQGQFGYTTRSRFFKPRYPYSWDWTPRVVPVGIWDSLTLRWGVDAAFDIARVRASLTDDNCSGRVDIALDVHADAAEISCVVKDGARELGRVAAEVKKGRAELSIDSLRVEPWWPNGLGDARMYTLDVVVSVGGQVARQSVGIGFKRVDWRQCDGAPEGAEPWICEVNGKSVFLQGANWVPPRVAYHDSTEDEYRRLIDLYREMGCTVLRVWGGGILEKEEFYRLCDEAGILVWQEFPLSSSGVENLPPDDPEAIEALTGIVSSYIRRRGHHVSLLLWCGGNELVGGGPERPGEAFVPVDCSHPCVRAMRDVVEKEDAGRRFLPTSASGPTFYGSRENFGKGIHHDVHGPWGFAKGCGDMNEWREYWAEDDALFRSEVGMPGAMSLEMLTRYAGGEEIWPPTTDHWAHNSAWWTQWARLKQRLEGLPRGAAIEEYVEITQADQAEAYKAAALACRGRFPRCGGFIIWMGHDCYPCPANNSVIDFERNPKPAYYALRDVFRGGAGYCGKGFKLPRPSGGTVSSSQ